jgi:hypothetical protein
MECMVTLQCQKCGNDYQVDNYRASISKHCSRSCHNSVAGKIGGAIGGRIGGKKNKGNKRPDLAAYNKTHVRRGPEAANWGGDTVCYETIHVWVRRNFGRATKCRHCGTQEGRIQWANKSKQYWRVRKDWIQLCVTCHVRYDKSRRHIKGAFRFTHTAKKRRFPRC